MIIDASARLLYRLAFTTLRLWWLVRRPRRSAAAVAIWHEDRLLVVRASYRTVLDLPGGGLRREEAPVRAALRELREETGIELTAASVGTARRYRYRDHHCRMTTDVFPYASPSPPAPRADRREIVWTGLMSRDELRRSALSPLLKEMLVEEAQPPSGTRQISRA